MLSIVKSMLLEGIDGYIIEVQVDIYNGLPNFEIVGMPDIRVREAKQRVKSAIKNSKFEFVNRKIIINLSPANKRKEGTIFDISIAIGILISTGQIKINKIIDLEKTVFLGELSLDGKINRIDGILALCIVAKELGIKRLIIPKANEMEAKVISGIEIIAVSSLIELINYLKKGNKERVKNDYIFEIKEKAYDIDFSDVKGQENVKRALEISAARLS